MSQPDVTVSPESCPAHHPHTASRVFGEEAVIISPDDNTVRILNRTGARIWQLADGTRSPEQIAQVLVEEYQVDDPAARRSVERFLTELAAKKLLAPWPAGGAGALI